MSLYLRCPKLYKYRYTLGVKEPENPKAKRGTDIHAALENFFLGRPYPTTSKVLNYWRRYFENLKIYDPTPELEVAVDKDWNQVYFDDPAAIVRGKIDLTYVKDGIRHIIDYKTGRYYDSHIAQGKAYVAISPQEVGYATHFVYIDAPTTVMSNTYTPEDRQYEKERVIRLVNIINSDDEFTPTPSEASCRYCHLSWRNGGQCRDAK